MGSTLGIRFYIECIMKNELIMKINDAGSVKPRGHAFYRKKAKRENLLKNSNPRTSAINLLEVYIYCLDVYL